MKNVEKKNDLLKKENDKKAYQTKEGRFLSMEEIHGKGLNFFGTNFRM